MKYLISILLLVITSSFTVEHNWESLQKPKVGDFILTMDDELLTDVKIEKGKSKWLKFYDSSGNKIKFNQVKLYRKRGKEFLTNGVSGRGCRLIHDGTISIYIEEDRYMQVSGQAGSFKKYYMAKGLTEIALVTTENTRKFLTMKDEPEYSMINDKIESYLKRAEKSQRSNIARNTSNTCIKAIKAYNRVYKY